MATGLIRALALFTASMVSAAALAQALSMQPGQWEIVTTTTAAEMPGAPPAVANMMRGRSMTIKRCVTPQEVAEGPQATMKRDKSCKVGFHTGVGGRFTSEMMCQQAGSTARATSSGTMTPTSFSSTSRMVMSGAQAMTITSTATGRRVGACKS
jgi:hypothetical protein